MTDHPLVVAYDVKRLVDAYQTKTPHQGITRYTLRLFQELKKLEGEVVVKPVYLHPLNPQRIGVEKAIAETAGLDAVADLFGENVEIPWNRHPVRGALLRGVNYLERYSHRFAIAKRPLSVLQRRLITSSFRTSVGRAIQGEIFHSPVNPLPPRKLTPGFLRVVTVHDCIYLRFPDLYPAPGKTPAIRKTLDSINPKRDYVICDSESTRRDLHCFLEIDSDRTAVIPLSADPQFFNPDKGRARAFLEREGVEPQQYFLTLAQSEKRKNILTVVKSFNLFLRKSYRPDLKLILVTWERYRKDLQAMLEREGLMSESIRILIDVDDPTLSGLYALAVGLVYVPLYEGFGIPPLEAMASGCPVIVARNSSLPEVVGDAGIYVDALDCKGIARAIGGLAYNPAACSFLEQQGRARAASFSWEKTARLTVDFYREIYRQSDLASS